MTYDKLLAVLDEVPNPTAEDAAAAIRALIAERDEYQMWDGYERTRALDAEAKVARLRALLREARADILLGVSKQTRLVLLPRIDAELATEGTP